MKIQIQIRKAKPEDFENGLLETLAVISDDLPTPNQGKEILSRREIIENQTYVAIVDKQVVGTVSLIMELKIIHAGKHVAHVEDIAVRKKWQNKGIGKKLMEHIIQDARKTYGCYKLLIDCKPDLVKYYSQFGFKKWHGSMRLDV